MMPRTFLILLSFLFYITMILVGTYITTLLHIIPVFPLQYSSLYLYRIMESSILIPYMHYGNFPKSSQILR